VVAATAAAVRGLPDHHFLDRLVRSRWWIPVLGVLLTGVVAIQVEVLKYGASYGRNINLAGSLQSANQLLRLDISRLSDPERIERLAAGYGMVTVGPTNVDFVVAHRPGAIGRAIRSIKPPDTQGFMTALAAQGSPSGSTPAAAGSVSAGTVAASTTTPVSGAASSATTPAGSSVQQSSATGTAPATTGTGATGATAGTVATAGAAPTAGTSPTAGTTPTAGAVPTAGTDATSASTTASPVSTPTTPGTGAANPATAPGYAGSPDATATTTAAATDNGGAALPTG
jgi:hypothetical protein